MLYPMQRLHQALNGDINELMELTVLLEAQSAWQGGSATIEGRDSELANEGKYLNSKGIMTEIERINATAPTVHTRYLLAKYYKHIHDESVSRSKFDTADDALNLLTKEGYPLALCDRSFYYNRHRLSELPTFVLSSSNPLIRCRLIDAKRANHTYTAKKAFAEYVKLFNQLDISDNRYLRRIILHRIGQLLEFDHESDPLLLFEDVRKFYLDNSLYSEYSAFIEAAKEKFNPD